MKHFILMSQNGSILNRTEWTTSSEMETFAVGFQIASHLTAGSIVAFYGALGSGKTTLIKAIVHFFTSVAVDEVHSPTFTYCVPYESASKLSIYHFDLYRLKNCDEFLALGLDEFLLGEGISLIEWSERIDPLLAKNHVRITLSHQGSATRSIIYEEIKF